jgi:pimeloyl-ACP methyl ester carboxylesterase
MFAEMSSFEDAGSRPGEARQTDAPDGAHIAFDLYPNPGRTAVVVIPGFWRTRRYPAIVAVAGRIARHLAPCAVIDLRGHGDSEGTFQFNLHEHEDAAAVGRAVMRETEADQLVLLGFSAGGAIAISTAARHEELRVAGLVLVSPVCDFRRVIPRPNPFLMHRHLSMAQAVRSPRFRWPGSARLSPLEDVERIAAPLCLIHARNDWLVGHKHSESLARRARRAELHSLPIRGRYHADKLFDVAPATVWPIVEGFVRSVIGDR